MLSILHLMTGTGKEIGSDELKKINVPCLILWGEYDNLIPIKEYAMKFLNDLSNVKLEVIPESGHAPFVEKPSLVYERIHRFLTT